VKSERARSKIAKTPVCSLQEIKEIPRKKASYATEPKAIFVRAERMREEDCYALLGFE
jgi:hypothetical protein